MIGILVHMLEGIILFLTALIAYRVTKLYQAQQSLLTEDSESQTVVDHLLNTKTKTNQEYETKMAALKEAQIFVGTQLLPLKRMYPDLTPGKYDWLTERAAIYLVGAIEHITNSHQCHSQSRQELISLILKSNMQIPLHVSCTYINEALYNTTNKDNASIVALGTSAASNWLSTGTIPEHMQLAEHISRNGIIA